MRFSIISLVSIFLFFYISPASSLEFYTPSRCATTNTSDLLAGSDIDCSASGGDGILDYYYEYVVFQNSNFLVFTITQLSDKGTVFKSVNRFGKRLSDFKWIKDQKPKYKRSEERAVKIGFWGKHAKSYNAKMESFNGSCFALYAAGGFTDDANNRSHAFYALLCKKNDKEFPVDERNAISEHFKITHKFFNR